MILSNNIIAYIGLGANQGDRCATIMQALVILDDSPNIAVGQVSQLIETTPIGGPDQQSDYLNGAAEIRTPLSAEQLLATMLDVESQLGRRRTGKWGPRTIDLDLLLYGDQIIDQPQLRVPHPLMHKRLFVLRPLAQIAPAAIHPILGQSIEQIRNSLEAGSND